MKGVHTLAKSNHEGIVQIIDEFKKWNPAANNWFRNKTQRKACEDIIKYIGLDVALREIPNLPKINAMNHVGSADTPQQYFQKREKIKGNLEMKKNKLTII